MNLKEFQENFVSIDLSYKALFFISISSFLWGNDLSHYLHTTFSLPFHPVITTIFVAGLYMSLGFVVKRQYSKAALTIAVIVYLADISTGFYLSQNQDMDVFKILGKFVLLLVVGQGLLSPETQSPPSE